MQHKITKPSKLLNKHGELIQKGYATSPLLRYRRKDAAYPLRLKEWDYYLIYNDSYGTALTIGRSSAILLISATLFDFNKKTQITRSFVRLVPNKYLSMPESSEKCNIQYQDSMVSVSILHSNDKRNIELFIKNFNNKTTAIRQNTPSENIQEHNKEQNSTINDLKLSITLSHELKDSMVIATPFPKCKKQFYYNQKIIGMNALGYVKTGNQTIRFTPFDSFGLLDWGRGIWPYKTKWYWGACQGIIYGNQFGFNLGYGFGDTSAATENMLFFNGFANKLKDVTFHIPKNCKDEYEYMLPWKITSSDNRLKLKFIPLLDRSANLSIILLATNQHQVFGKYSGTVVLDDGTIVYLKDFLGFAERVVNRW